ncbi:MAG: hypothetical protein JWM37_208 [Candidatus Saccharibacteria bacterium]|nr:hypothetical protein [Candidatus Saccharibacteria bacterium]
MKSTPFSLRVREYEAVQRERRQNFLERMERKLEQKQTYRQDF